MNAFSLRVLNRKNSPLHLKDLLFYVSIFSAPTPLLHLCVCVVLYICFGSHVAGTLRQFDALVSHPCALCPTPWNKPQKKHVAFFMWPTRSRRVSRGWGVARLGLGGSAGLSQVINNGANMHLSRMLCIKTKRLIEIGTHPEPFSLPIYPIKTGSRGSHFFQ